MKEAFCFTMHWTRIAVLLTPIVAAVGCDSTAALPDGGGHGSDMSSPSDMTRDGEPLPPSGGETVEPLDRERPIGPWWQQGDPSLTDEERATYENDPSAQLYALATAPDVVDEPGDEAETCVPVMDPGTGMVDDE